MSFKKILVPVDFSPNSADAVRSAAEFSRRFGAELTLVHVFQPFASVVPEGYLAYTSAQLEEMLSSFRTQLASAKKDAEAAGAILVHTKQLQGTPAAEIEAFARNEHFDLIVMGTHGRTGIQHMLLGSVTERVVRHAPCPVLTVRGQPAADKKG